MKELPSDLTSIPAWLALLTLKSQGLMGTWKIRMVPSTLPSAAGCRGLSVLFLTSNLLLLLLSLSQQILKGRVRALMLFELVLDSVNIPGTLHFLEKKSR